MFSAESILSECHAKAPKRARDEDRRAFDRCAFELFSGCQIDEADGVDAYFVKIKIWQRDESGLGNKQLPVQIFYNVFIRKFDEGLFVCVVGEVTEFIFETDDDVEAFVFGDEGRGEDADVFEDVAFEIQCENFRVVIVALAVGSM